jgi:hypothetical protein
VRGFVNGMRGNDKAVRVIDTDAAPVDNGAAAIDTDTRKNFTGWCDTKGKGESFVKLPPFCFVIRNS